MQFFHYFITLDPKDHANHQEEKFTFKWKRHSKIVCLINSNNIQTLLNYGLLKSMNPLSRRNLPLIHCYNYYKAHCHNCTLLPLSNCLHSYRPRKRRQLSFEKTPFLFQTQPLRLVKDMLPSFYRTINFQNRIILLFFKLIKPIVEKGDFDFFS